VCGDVAAGVRRLAWRLLLLLLLLLLFVSLCFFGARAAVAVAVAVGGRCRLPSLLGPWHWPCAGSSGLDEHKVALARFG
jgi:hypothetical protein